MVDDRRVHPAPRARAVLDPALESVLARADDLAKRWTIALIGARPLDAMASVPLEDLAREAPALCAQTLRALQSDVELERLTGSGPGSGREASATARKLAAMAGARDGVAAVEAVEALRGVLWEALLDELSAPSARLLADISDRLAYVCACALAATIGASLPAVGASVAGAGDTVVVSSAPPSPRPEHGVPGGGASSVPAEKWPLAGAVIVDEREGVQLARSGRFTSSSEAIAAGSQAHGGRSSEPERPLPWDESPPVAPVDSLARQRQSAWEESPPVAPVVSAAPRTPPDEIEIRDERGEEGPSAWIGSIGRQVTHFESDGHPFAVLLVELLDLERIRSLESVAELTRLSAQVQDVLASELRPLGSGSLTRERPGRYWLLAPETDRAGAERLAERLAAAVSSSLGHRGAPLEVVIGSAVGPDDGLRAPALAAHADVGLYAARSSTRRARGRAVAPVDESA
jgi:GGDEF domain-containing protein